jgi:sec-independent protein translocase protein TatC
MSTDPAAKDTFVSHLMELRDRLLRSVLVVLAIFVVNAIFANDLYTFFAQPLMAALPEGNSMISTQPHGPFFVPFKLAFALAVIAAVPFLLYQLWAFVAPGLYENEKAMVMPLLVSSTVLFYAGIAFAYYLVFPIIFKFFALTAPEGVAVMTDINEYFTFAMKLFFAFGISFEVPVATVLLVRAGATTTESLAQKRPYIIVGAFVVGMMMTPPDIFSQTLLAVPVWVLFELGLFLSKNFKPRPQEPDDELDEQEFDKEFTKAERELDELK